MPIKFSELTTKGLEESSKIIGLYVDNSSDSGSSNCIINAGDFAKQTALETVNSEALHKAGVETVTGSKTFDNTATFNGNVNSNAITTVKNKFIIKSDTLDVANASTTYNTVEFNWKDKNEVLFGVDALRTDTNGSIYRHMFIKAHNSNTWQSLGIGFDSNDKVYTYAPTPANGDNSTQIATTNWCIELMKRIYPVGSIYIGTTTTCPLASVIPGSTWTLVAANRALWTGSGSNANTTIEPGLPNITGTAQFREAHGAIVGITGLSGSLYGTNTGKITFPDGGGDLKDIGDTRVLNINASRSSSIYGNSSTVQPPAYVVNVWRRTA